MNIKEGIAALLDLIKGLMQPLITVVAVILLLALAQSGYDQDKIFALSGVVLLFWFGYTAIKNFNFNGKDSLPKVNGGQVFSTDFDTTVEDAVSAVEEIPGDTKIPFDKKAFMAEVKRDVKGVYGEINNCTVFYEARDKIAGNAAPWQFNNKQAQRDAWACVFELAGKAFTEIWGVSFQVALDHLNDDGGCTTCGTRTCYYPDIDFKARMLGMEYYASLLDYRKTLSILNSLS
jgi:hypothetical protein